MPAGNPVYMYLKILLLQANPILPLIAFDLFPSAQVLFELASFDTNGQ